MTTKSAPERSGPSPDGRDGWRAAVGGVLAKSRQVDSADLPAEPERILDITTYDGVTIAPLYTAEDAVPERPPPGVAPYTRGRSTRPGWDVRTRHGLGGAQDDPAEVNRRVLHDLENGATSLWLAVGGTDLPVSGIPVALAGVYLDLAPIVLDAGRELTAAAETLLALLDAGEVDETKVRIGFGADPVRTLVRTGHDLTGEAVALARRAVERPGCRTFMADGTLFADAGASDSDELGAAVGEGVAYVRAMTEAGIGLSDAVGQVEFRLGAGDDQFLNIAKFRAARTMWARVAEVAGVPHAGAAPQHAVTSGAMMAQRDPWVNLLRTTLAAFGAGLGGADAVTVLPFDAAVPGGVSGVDVELAARLARNTQLVLLEEAHLGRVADPAGGSYYVEQLTDALADAGWQWFQEIEAAGGLPAALELVTDRIAATRQQRSDDIAHRRTPITGVSEFPNLADPALPTAEMPTVDGPLVPIRYASAFETLRDRSDAHLAATGSRPSAFLATLGPTAEHNVRAAFTTNLLAAGGVAVATPSPSADLGVAFAEAGTTVALLCGADKRYATEGAAAVAALRRAGASLLLVVGSEKTFPDGDPGPDGFVGPGVDAPQVLGTLLDALGVAT